MKVSFDFDDTLAVKTYIGTIPIPLVTDILCEYHAMGVECIVLTARGGHEVNRMFVESFLHQYKLRNKISQIIYTNHEPKGPFAKELGVVLHYDDSQFHLTSVREHGIKAIDSLCL